MLDPRFHRKQLFVDKDVQGVLLARVGVYWACCLITILLILLAWRLLTGPSQDLHLHLEYLWFHYRPILIAAFILLPILVADTLRLSNRFAGPMVRLKRGLGDLADGRTDVAPVHFRRGDFWHEFAHEFNRLLQRVQQNSPRLADDTQAERKSEDHRHTACGGTLSKEAEMNQPTRETSDETLAASATAASATASAAGRALSAR